MSDVSRVHGRPNAPRFTDAPKGVVLGLLAIGWVLAGCATVQHETPDVERGAAETPSVLAKGGDLVAFNGLPSGLSTDARATVSDLLDSFESSGGEAAFVDDAAYEIEIFLRAQGFAAATTTYQVLGDGTALIEILLGEQSTIGQVTVVREGDSPLTEDELERYVNGPRTGLFGGGDMLYLEARVAHSAQIATQDLISLGYLDAQATLDDPGPTSAGGPVDVTLTVRAGPRYTVSESVFRLADGASVSEELRQRVEETIRELTQQGDGQPATYDPRLGGRIRSAVDDTLGQNGFPDARITVDGEIDRLTQSVSLAISADPGPLVVVTEVRFEGEGRTKDTFLRARLQIEPGQSYDARKVRQGVRRLYRSGIFAEVRPRLEGEGESRVLVLELIEQPSLDVYFEPGYGSYELFRATVGAQDRNLFGTGINGLAEVTVAIRAIRARVRLTDPFFVGDTLVGDVEIEFQERVEPSFIRETINLGSYVTREWSRVASTTLGYRYGLSDAKDVQADTIVPAEEERAVNIGSILLTQWYDTRNAILAPTSGFRTDATLELALDGLGSQLNFIRARSTSAYMIPITRDDVAAFGLRIGVIAPVEDTALIPIQERFFAGGENSVRSYRESQLGPKDQAGEPLGGEAMATASFEWRHEILGPFQTAAFVDVGFVETFVDDFFDPRNVGVGLGAGIRYMLPIGPLRVDAAVNPDPEEFEDEWVIHFSIGMPF